MLDCLISKGVWFCESQNPTGKRSISSLSLLLPLGIELVDVSDQMLLETVAFCAHMDGAASTGNVYAGEPLPYELMVMKGVTRAHLNQILDLLSKAGVKRVERKAVVTETNRSWTFLKLYQEVCREHDMMTGQTPTN